ncbi:rhomboid family intramembrane serine protease [Flavobacterium noncentrifugens]|uniref:Membrane associated serine protease, rhomboid family n=1 Tax=Flavobacterium noncentrifugens TaxID=1128970 RepID=A0A1G8VGV2_9FLAO|nr:rhomboid family intramembrane serine protease [Flavobacterium noncentrifugens]GEP50495.1 rhomboid family intramembrane serine protease [Flavobacterium noncentrifugens]SDJ65134.1 Membrane associated serine protease, rhomboid family [Flavobacterium noncentrifugens]
MSIFDDLKLQYKMGGFEQKVIYWNVAAFVISIVFFYQFKLGFFAFPDWISLSSNVSDLLWKPWTLLTYSFFHAGFFHLFFNMIVLNFSGRLFLTFFTQKQFLGLYLMAGIFAGLAFIGGYLILGQTAAIVGASGAIMAILVATATYSPYMNLRLLLVGNVKLWQLTAVIVILDLLQIFVENTGGHIAHLAGAFFGFFYIKLLQNGTDLTKGVTSIINFFANIFSGRKASPLKTVHRNYDRKPVKTVSKIVTKDKTQQQIDEILDKISQSGYDSLTKEEKEFLFKAGK